MVSGDIDEKPLLEPAPGLIDAGVVGDDWPKLAKFWLRPVVGADDLDDVSPLRTSMADDAAPRAKNMAELQQRRA
jgi:hypothetical protein